jgi:hypothetical protein
LYICNDTKVCRRNTALQSLHLLFCREGKHLFLCFQEGLFGNICFFFKFSILNDTFTTCEVCITMPNLFCIKLIETGSMAECHLLSDVSCLDLVLSENTPKQTVESGVQTKSVLKENVLRNSKIKQSPIFEYFNFSLVLVNIDISLFSFRFSFVIDSICCLSSCSRLLFTAEDSFSIDVTYIFSIFLIVIKQQDFIIGKRKFYSRPEYP